MRQTADARRRWLGGLFLGLAAGLLLWGETGLRRWLKGGWFAVYWLACFLFTGLAMLVALLDLRAMRRRARQQQRELLERALRDIEAEKVKRARAGAAEAGKSG